MPNPGELFSLVADKGDTKTTPLNLALIAQGAMHGFVFRDDTKRALTGNCDH
jgi:hypothetical protein